MGWWRFWRPAPGTLGDAAVGLAHAIYRETDGNPFFVSEVLRHLAETGAIFQDSDRTVGGEGLPDRLALPDSVRMVIGARVGRLGKEAGRVLSVASVIGRDFDLRPLGPSNGHRRGRPPRHLGGGGGRALVREPADGPGRFNFAHALIQRTFYEDMGPNRRAGPTGRWRSTRRPLRRPPRNTGGRNGAPLDCRSAHRLGQGHQVLLPGR